MKEKIILGILILVCILAICSSILSRKRSELRNYCRSLTLELLKRGESCTCVPGIRNQTYGCYCYCSVNNTPYVIFLGRI